MGAATYRCVTAVSCDNQNGVKVEAVGRCFRYATLSQFRPPAGALAPRLRKKNRQNAALAKLAAIR